MAMVMIAAFVWGLAEATVFFVVPDVILSAIAVRDLRQALIAALVTVCGAVAGGLVMYHYARADPAAAQALVLAVPGISEPMSERVRELTHTGLLAGMVKGSISGLPYKLFAVEAAGSGVPAWAFAAASVPARLIRFAGVILLSAGLSRLLGGWSLRARYLLLGAVWIVFYVAYFAAVGW